MISRKSLWATQVALEGYLGPVDIVMAAPVIKCESKSLNLSVEGEKIFLLHMTIVCLQEGFYSLLHCA